MPLVILFFIYSKSKPSKRQKRSNFSSIFTDTLAELKSEISWSQWSNWSLCSDSCPRSKRSRRRQCSFTSLEITVPQNFCAAAPSSEIQDCCLIEPYGTWSNWLEIKACPTCNEVNETSEYFRLCLFDGTAIDSHFCHGGRDQSHKLTPCPSKTCESSWSTGWSF